MINTNTETIYKEISQLATNEKMILLSKLMLEISAHIENENYRPGFGDSNGPKPFHDPYRGHGFPLQGAEAGTGKVRTTPPGIVESGLRPACDLPPSIVRFPEVNAVSEYGASGRLPAFVRSHRES